MREPYMVVDGKATPYSQVPIYRLQRRAAGAVPRIAYEHPDSEPNEFYNFEFRKMYAAALLRERGLL